MNKFFILLVLCACFSSLAFSEEDPACYKLKQEIKYLDEEINSTKPPCSNNPGRFAPYCKMNLEQLKEAFRKKMNDFIIIDGIQGIKNAIAGEAQDLSKVSELKLDEFDKAFKDFEFTVERGSMAQESFYANTDDKFFFLDFQQHLDQGNITTFNADAVESYFDDKCSNKAFSICDQYTNAKAKYSSKPAKWKELLESMHGLGVASSKYKGRDTDEVKRIFGEFIDYLNIPVTEEENPTRIKEVMNSDAFVELREKMAKMKSSPSTQNAAQLSDAAKEVKKQLVPLTYEMDEFTDKDMLALQGDMSIMGAAYKKLEDEMDSYIFKTKDYSPEGVNGAIARVQEQIKETKELASLKLKSNGKPIMDEIKSVFAVECEAASVDTCLTTLKGFKNASCSSGDSICEAKRAAAPEHIEKLEKLTDVKDIKELENALACYQSDDAKDPQELMSCLNQGRANPITDVKSTLVKYKKELDTMQELIDKTEANGEIKRKSLLKSFAIYNLQKNSTCNTEEKAFRISTQCEQVDLLKDNSVNALLDSTGEVISYYNFMTNRYDILENQKNIQKLCKMRKYKNMMKETCGDQKVFKPLVYTDNTVPFVNTFANFVPRIKAWAEKVANSKANTPGGGTGLLSGFMRGFFPGYLQYAYDSQRVQAGVDWAFDSKQDMLNWNEHKDQYFKDIYAWQMNNNFYPSFAGGKWNYYTDPFNLNFNYQANRFIYPSEFNVTTPTAIVTI